MLARIGRRLKQMITNMENVQALLKHQALVLYMNVHGRVYFKHGPWYEWRLPALGAEPINRETAPELFNPDYNTPFKFSPYNTRDILRPDHEIDFFVSELP